MWFSRFVVLGCAVVLAVSCSREEERRSSRGESCEIHSDCADGLRCVGRICAEGRFNVALTEQACFRIDCREDEDCCTESPVCTSLRTQCDAGSVAACEEAERACACNSVCTDNRCRPTCDDDNPCPSGLHCQSGECVPCLCDAHCGSGRICRDARCVAECRRDADCPRFHECRDTECVLVGCANDRECVAALGNVLAFCEDGTCDVRCSTDIECDNAESFRYRACIDGACRVLGCETDEECRALVQRDGSGSDAECRPPREPEPEGIAGVGGEECPEPPCVDTCPFANDGMCDEPFLCDPGTDCTDCRCGNGQLDPGEQCDGALLR